MLMFILFVVSSDPACSQAIVAPVIWTEEGEDIETEHTDNDFLWWNSYNFVCWFFLRKHVLHYSVFTSFFLFLFLKQITRILNEISKSLEFKIIFFLSFLL